MKKLQLTIMLAAAASFAVSGCKSSTPRSEADSLAATAGIDTLAVSLATYGDAQEDSTVEYSLSVDYPQGDDSLAVGARQLVAREMAALYMPQEDGVEDVYRNRYPAYKGSIDNGQTLADFYGKGAMGYLMDNHKQMRKLQGASAELPPLYQKARIRKGTETAHYVTFNITDEINMGGAHGAFFAYGVNLSKHSFKPVDHPVDSTKLKALQPLLRRKVLEYVHDAGEENATDATLNSVLTLELNGIIPLPMHAPYAEGDSLCFVYQQYEIAPYAMGLVNFKVAYKDIKPYLTKEGKSLFGE